MYFVCSCCEHLLQVSLYVTGPYLQIIYWQYRLYIPGSRTRQSNRYLHLQRGHYFLYLILYFKLCPVHRSTRNSTEVAHCRRTQTYPEYVVVHCIKVGS